MASDTALVEKERNIVSSFRGREVGGEVWKVSSGGSKWNLRVRCNMEFPCPATGSDAADHQVGVCNARNFIREGNFHCDRRGLGIWCGKTPGGQRVIGEIEGQKDAPK